MGTRLTHVSRMYPVPYVCGSHCAPKYIAVIPLVFASLMALRCISSATPATQSLTSCPLTRQTMWLESLRGDSSCSLPYLPGCAFLGMGLHTIELLRVRLTGIRVCATSSASAGVYYLCTGLARPKPTATGPASGTALIRTRWLLGARNAQSDGGPGAHADHGVPTPRREGLRGNGYLATERPRDTGHSVMAPPIQLPLVRLVCSGLCAVLVLP